MVSYVLHMSASITGELLRLLQLWSASSVSSTGKSVLVTQKTALNERIKNLDM